MGRETRNAVGAGRGKWWRFVATLASLLILLHGAVVVDGASASPQPAPAQCRFVLGFAALREAIASTVGSDVVGQCRENEYHGPTGDGVQLATGGLLIWRKASNWTGFTDGHDTWVAGPAGVEKRPNGERFPWEPADGRDVTAYFSAPTVSVPPPIEVDEMVRQVLVLHVANGGSTFNRYFGDLSGKRLFAVSLYPERGVVIDDSRPPLEILRWFILDNSDLLRDPRVSVGTWFDEDNNKTYLDISATVADQQQAMALGERYNQIAIFDLYSMKEIDTGGTGEKVPNLPPPENRLLPVEARR